MNCYKEGYIFTGSARPFSASRHSRIDAHFLCPVRALDDRCSGALGKTGPKVTLRVKGCRIEKIGTMKLLLLHRSNIERCYLSKETIKQYSCDWVAWPTTPRAREAITKIRVAYLHFMKTARCSTSTSRVKKSEEFYLTLIFNRTAEGGDPSNDWGIMFSVIIDGPSRVPSSFQWNNTSTDENERAMVYIEPFLNAIFRLAALPHILGISESGRLCMYSGGRLWKEDLDGYGVFVILGCNTPLLLESYGVNTLKNGDAETLWPYHTVVGVAYIHDYMYGRVSEELDNGLLATRTLDVV